MTNVSKNKLPKKTLDQLFTQFTSLFTNTDQKNISGLFESLFSESEKTMFIKRLAVVLMLSEGYSAYAVAKALKVSESTALVAKEKFLLGEYNSLIKTTQRRNFDSKKFWSTVDVMLRLGMPSYSGKDRWKGVDRNLHRNT